MRPNLDPLLAIPGWLDKLEGEELFHLASQTSSGEGHVVEIGSYKGRSTAFLAAGCATKAGQDFVHAVDHFVGSSEMLPGGANPTEGVDGETSYYSEFHANLVQVGLKQRVITHIGKSTHVAAFWDKPIRLLFIDGEHDYESVRADYDAWAPHVVRGGYICFHDYCPHWPGVVRLVQELRGHFITIERTVVDLAVCRKI